MFNNTQSDDGSCLSLLNCLSIKYYIPLHPHPLQKTLILHARFCRSQYILTTVFTKTTIFIYAVVQYHKDMYCYFKKKKKINTLTNICKIENRTCLFPNYCVCLQYTIHFEKKKILNRRWIMQRDITLNTDRWFGKIINQQPVYSLCQL